MRPLSSAVWLTVILQRLCASAVSAHLERGRSRYSSKCSSQVGQKVVPRCNKSRGGPMYHRGWSPSDQIPLSMTQTSSASQSAPARDTPPPPLEVIPLLTSGPSSNRVDLIFFSDGYIPSEKDKFFADALRLAEDVSKNHTFNTVQPLLNFWAGFSPSNSSGLGVDGSNETPFGLYRSGTELRGVYYAYEDVARAACDSLGTQCDYPILLGNDPRYGGLGGDFTVITASIENGPLVLRHELGHSILDVGEEYDGGEVYDGNNASYDIEDLPWRQWLSDPSRVDKDGNPIVERSVMAMQAYPWTLLNTTTPWSVIFDSAGTYSKYSIQFSLSGIPDKGDLRVTLDGADLAWTPRADIKDDRWFYDFLVERPLAGGQHNLTFELLNSDAEGIAQLCSTEILEYGDDDEFILAPGFNGVYPTYSYDNETSYRPTNNDCLMRAVTTPDFCHVCLETLWVNLLEGISLIDNLTETCEEVAGFNSPAKVLQLDLLPIANLRQTPVSPKESYTITWKKDGQVLEEFANKTRIELGGEDVVGNYSVKVKFDTEEVRVSSKNLEASRTYEVKNECL